MGRRRIDSIDGLVEFVEDCETCYLFRKGGGPRICDLVGGDEPTIVRGKVLELCEEAHIGGRIFLTVDKKGGLMAMSLKMFNEMIPQRRALELTSDERRLLAAIDRPLSTPQLRLVSSLPKARFDKSLTGLRFKMRITLAEIRRESKTKHLNCFDILKR